MSQREYLLESEEMTENANAISDYLTGNKENEKTNGFDSIPVLGIFKNLIVAVPVYGYDLPELENQYPVGFHTENALFISTRTINAFKEEEQYGKYNEKARLTVASMLLDLVEDTYQITFNDHQKLAIASQILSDVIVNKEFVKINRIPALTWKELGDVAQQAGMQPRDYESMIGTNIVGINKALFTIPEIHNPENPLSILAEKVISFEVQKHITNLNPTVEEFKELYHDGMGVESRAYAIEVINHQLQTIQNKVKKEGLTSEQFLNELKDKLLPKISLVNNDLYKYALDDLTKRFFEKTNSSWVNSNFDIKTDFALLLENDENYSIERRSILVKSLSRTNVFAGLQFKNDQV